MAQKKSSIPQLIYRYAGPNNNPGYFFIAVNEAEEQQGKQQDNEQKLFIYSDDFEVILPLVKAQYPLTDEHTGEHYESFDPCWDNPIPSAVWVNILAELDQLTAENEDQRIFIDQFIAWIKSKLEDADMIIVEGTL